MTVTTPRIDSGKLGELAAMPDGRGAETVFAVNDLTVSYSGNVALKGVDLDVRKNFVTAIIGPSGCGKSTLLRAINRMNDLIPNCSTAGRMIFDGEDIYAAGRVDDVRRRIGMVFQKPNPFPKRIFDNMAYGPRIHRMAPELDEMVEKSLRAAGSGTRSRTASTQSALGMSGGQQQRLCIARTMAVEPEIVLMDEPTARSTRLRPRASRSSCASSRASTRSSSSRTTCSRPHASATARRSSPPSSIRNPTQPAPASSSNTTSPGRIFSDPRDERTENYITGRFG